jgi:hypothetical protein
MAMGDGSFAVYKCKEHFLLEWFFQEVSCSRCNFCNEHRRRGIIAHRGLDALDLNQSKSVEVVITMKEFLRKSYHSLL